MTNFIQSSNFTIAIVADWNAFWCLLLKCRIELFGVGFAKGKFNLLDQWINCIKYSTSMWYWRLLVNVCEKFELSCLRVFRTSSKFHSLIKKSCYLLNIRNNYHSFSLTTRVSILLLNRLKNKDEYLNSVGIFF